MDTTGRIGEKVRKKTKGIREKARKKPKGKPYLPDDIIPNILCRLPAKNVMQCRLVCKGWRDLTLDRDFVGLHCKNSIDPPTILVAKRMIFSKVEHLLDKWWEGPAPMKLMIHSCHFDSGDIDKKLYRALFSHAGLFVFEQRYTEENIVIILNPINDEKVTIIVSGEQIWRSEIYGVYFHPSLKEYCSLWMILPSPKLEGQQSKQTRYKLLNFGFNPCFKTINNPFGHRHKRCSTHTLFMDKYLYWLIDPENYRKYTGYSDIMQFDIVSQEFTVLLCPVPQDMEEFTHFQTHLLNIDGTLSFLLIIFPNLESTHITIWRLENHAEQLWTAASYTFSIGFSPRFGGPKPIAKPIAVVDGKLALSADDADETLIVLDLMQGLGRKSIVWEKKHNGWLLCFSHQMSLASLKNCTSTIYIDQDGHEVDNESNQYLM